MTRPTTVSIREATARDMEALIGLLHESDVLHRVALPDVFNDAEAPVRAEQYVNRLLDEENGVILVAEREGAVVGLVQLAVYAGRSDPTRKRRCYAEIGDLAVTSEHRRAGIGRMLMAAANDWAAARGAVEIELGVWEFNRAAAAFYEALGYETTRRTMRKLVD